MNVSYIIIGKRKEMYIDANIILNAFSFISRLKIILVLSYPRTLKWSVYARIVYIVRINFGGVGL